MIGKAQTSCGAGSPSICAVLLTLSLNSLFAALSEHVAHELELPPLRVNIVTRSFAFSSASSTTVTGMSSPPVRMRSLVWIKIFVTFQLYEMGHRFAQVSTDFKNVNVLFEGGDRF